MWSNGDAGNTVEWSKLLQYSPALRVSLASSPSVMAGRPSRVGLRPRGVGILGHVEGVVCTLLLPAARLGPGKHDAQVVKLEPRALLLQRHTSRHYCPSATQKPILVLLFFLADSLDTTND